MAANSRVILHVDLDAFFASCEEQRNPDIRGKPVIICNYTRGQESGAVTTANYMARGLGIKSGMPVSLAKRAAKKAFDVVFLPTDINYYLQVSGQVMEILQAHADIFEPVSIDEAFLDVTARMEGDFAKAEALARQIKAEVMAKTNLTCSVGIASNKLLAKTASDFRKPNGLTTVLPGNEAEFLVPLKVFKLFGVGVKSEEVLIRKGIKTIGDLAEIDLKVLKEWFGVSRGTYFHFAAQGLDDSPVAPPAETQQFSRIGTLPADSRDPETLLAFLAPFCDDVVAKAKARGVKFKGIGFLVVTADMKTFTRNRTLEEAADSVDKLKAVVKDLVIYYLDQSPGILLRRAGIRISAFVSASEAAAPPEGGAKQQRNLKDFF